MAFSCPFYSYCGTSDLSTIVPSADGTTRKFVKDGSTVHYKTGRRFRLTAATLCRHRIKFPMDATYGDKLQIRIERLSEMRAVLAIGPEYDADKVKAYSFTDSLNKRGGATIQVSYPLNTYLTLTYDTRSGTLRRPAQNAEYHFTVMYLSRPSKDPVPDQKIEMNSKSNEQIQTIIQNSVQVVGIQEIENQNVKPLMIIISVLSALMFIAIGIIVWRIMNQMKFNERVSDVIKL